VADSRLRGDIEANIQQDADDLRPQGSMTTRDTEALIDRCLVPKAAPEPRRLSPWRFEAGYITSASNISNALVDAILSVFGLIVLFTSTAGVVFMIAVLEYELNFFQAMLPAGCAGLLSPVVVVALIRIVDLMLRVAFLLLVAVLVTGLIEVVQQVFFGS
jgi:hypothetical protein